MIILYAFLIASPSLFNFGSIFPLWLFFNLSSGFYTTLKGYSTNFFIWLALFPFIASASYLVNFNQSKVGHLIAYYIIFLAVIPSFSAYFCFPNNSPLQSLSKLNTFLSLICLTIFITSTIDYILLVNNIDYSLYIPSDANRPIMAALASRARAFWNEPTDLAMATNSFFSMYLGSSHYLDKIKQKNNHSNILPVILICLVWIYVLFLTQSAAAFGALFVSLILLLCYKVFQRNNSYLISNSTIRIFLCSAIFIIILSSISIPLIDNFTETTFQKLALNTNMRSVSHRLLAWNSVLNYFSSDMNPFQWFLGSGPGHISYLSETAEGAGSLSWILSVFGELGILGIGALGIILYKLSILAKIIPAEIQPYYFISISTLIIHLCTMTGFYLPVLPFVFSVPIIIYQSSSNLLKSQSS